MDFITYFFKSPQGKHLLNLASPGGAGRNKTLGQEEFLELEIQIPKDIEEQRKIANILSLWDKTINLNKKLISQKKEQKKGLTQILLTGKIRLNEGNLKPNKINERIELITSGKVPEGYKRTRIGIIPNNWDIKYLKDLCKGKGSYGIGVAATDYSAILPRYLRITDINGYGKLSNKDIKLCKTF